MGGMKGDDAIDPGAPPTCGGFGAAAAAAGMAVPEPAFIDTFSGLLRDPCLCFDIRIL